MTGNRRSVLQGIALQAFAEARDASKSALSYDRADRLTRAEDSQGGTHTQAYDALDRLTQQSGLQGSVSYAYDRSGRRTQMDASGQPATTYSYDPAGRLTGLSRGAQTLAMGYDPAGRRQTTTLPNGITRTDGYDAASRLTSIGRCYGSERRVPVRLCSYRRSRPSAVGRDCRDGWRPERWRIPGRAGIRADGRRNLEHGSRPSPLARVWVSPRASRTVKAT